VARLAGAGGRPSPRGLNLGACLTTHFFSEHDFNTDTEVLAKGDAFGYAGEIWQVKDIATAEGDDRATVRFTGWPNGVAYPDHVKGVDPRPSR